MTTVSANLSDDSSDVDEGVPTEIENHSTLSIGTMLAWVMNRLTLPAQSADEHTSLKTLDPSDALSETDLFSGLPSFPFFELPSEIRKMVLREVFSGSELTYSIVKTEESRSGLFECRLSKITNHRNFLMACKRCWFEAIELYYEETTLILGGDEDWTMHKLTTHIPIKYYKNVRKLFGQRKLSKFHLSSAFCTQPIDYLDPMPKLREAWLPLHDRDAGVQFGDCVYEAIWRELFGARALAEPMMPFQERITLKPNLKLYDGFEVSVFLFGATRSSRPPHKVSVSPLPFNTLSRASLVTHVLMVT